MDDRQFRQLLDHFNYSWEGYRRVRKGVKRRVRRHMQQVQCRNIDQYFCLLNKDEEARWQLECLMTVSVSRFLRDRLLWKIIEDQILPDILRINSKKVKFWSAGCACGEEVYSFRVVWEIIRARSVCMPELEMWATDMNAEYLRRAQEGVYPLSSLKEVPQKLRETCFHPYQGLYRVVPSLRKEIVWKVHNVLSDFGERGFQIIFLRNSILTYYNDELRESALKKVIECLAQGGFLIIGSHEKLPPQPKDLVAFSGQRYIFKRIRG